MKLAGIAVAFVFAALPAAADAQTSNPTAPLHRDYREGQILAYHMTGDNDGWTYAVDAQSLVKKDAAGAYHEDISWSGLVSDGKPMSLSPAMADYRQQLSLDPSLPPSPPDLRAVDPNMIGPVTDMMTFYVDLWLAAKFNSLKAPGDHFTFSNPMTASWADGTFVLTGQDAIDFDMTLKSVDTANQVAVLLVRHLPPQQPRISFPAAWMEKPVADTANNWVEVRKLEDGTYRAAAGKEYFDVEITVSLVDGRIERATMDNPVQTVERTCTDVALTQCSDQKVKTIVRKIELTRQP